ncbi:AfsR/SARP family transcriptional regulator [Sphaerisporangium fuscum]|uniref:AfsR/SARP family transcriptional regulator n=1 Tax=Sphaerisporangium fuscum TaxID=2835868 RepID=UPI001BDDAC5F|nr:BTAD domain-containing putative transcriptional regulator [Sphaerisporangium fuscum]
MEFQVLGPVGATVGARHVDIGPARQQCVLAALLIDVGQVVSTDQLIYRVWAEAPPGGARNTLNSYLARIRTILQSLGTDADGVALVRHTGGYALEADAERVDLYCFRRLVRQARDVADDRAGRLLREALDLWQADALTGLSGDWAEATRAQLDDERVRASLLYQDIQLKRGRHEELLPELRDLISSHPFDERLVARLMMVLYRSGRQAEALQLYEQVRSQLAEQLGVDPSPELQARHLEVLSSTPVSSRPTTVSTLPIPRQLPLAPVNFEGRARELAALDRMDEQNTDRLVTLVGTGGIGKTYLALHWAHTNLDRFPDGQLFANLRGFDAAGEHTEPLAVLRGFIEALGVEPGAIPADPDAQSALYRSLVADRRLLIVLDDARDAAHVIPVLPGSPACTVLITSRNRLADLAVTHGARTLALDVLDPGAARRMLTLRIGKVRAAAEADAVTALLEYCAGLPLALGILASRAMTHPGLPLAFLAEELREESSRLDALHVGGPGTDIRAIFASSYRSLEPSAARALGLLGLAPGPTIGLLAVTALLDLPIGRARSLLRSLEDAHLLCQYVPQRYRMHDLVRLCAMETAERDISAEERTVAMRRLGGFYLRGAFAADRLLYPNRPGLGLDLPVDGLAPEPPRDTAAALAWFDAEYVCLMAIQRLTAAWGWDTATLQLAWALDTYCWRQVRLVDGSGMWAAGLEAAERLEDTAARAVAHWRLGFSRAMVGERDGVLGHMYQALSLFKESGDAVSAAHVHQSLGWVFTQWGERRQALHHSSRALADFQTLDTPAWEANALNAAAWCLAQLDQHKQAYVYCEQALALFREQDDLDGEAATLDSMGYISHRMGRHNEAIGHYRCAVELRDATGNASQKADTLNRMGDAHEAAGEHAQAYQAWAHALDLYRRQHRVKDAERTQAKLDAAGYSAAGPQM